MQETQDYRNQGTRNIELQELGCKKHRTTGTRVLETQDHRNQDTRNIGLQELGYKKQIALQELGYKKYTTSGTRIQKTQDYRNQDTRNKEQQEYVGIWNNIQKEENGTQMQGQGGRTKKMGLECRGKEVGLRKKRI